MSRAGSIDATSASLIFARISFPSSDPKVASVASPATYGVRSLARAIGAFFLGHGGDTRGRKTVLLARLASPAQRTATSPT